MKKKGLIISTVVMVVVLIASLTTATYAWFSAQASATVDDLSITTKAADGLQIAMTNTENSVADIVSGNMNYANGKWEGDVNDWGSSLGFDGIQIGEITDAVTYYKKQNYAVFNGYAAADTITPGKTYYQAISLSATPGTVTTNEEYLAYSGTKYSKNESSVYKPVAAFSQNTEFFRLLSVVAKTGDSGLLQRNVVENGGTMTAEGIMGNGQFLVPTGYDESINPIGYEAANKNGNYYYLTMAIKPVTNVARIGFTMQFKPTQNGTAVENYGNAGAIAGAMASSARCNIKVATSDKSQTTQLAPFSAFKFDAGVLTQVSQDSYSAYEETDGIYNNNGAYSFYIANAEVNAGTIYYVTMEIWIEGTDNECSQDTAGGGFNLGIDFVYDKLADGTNVNTSTFTDLRPQ